MSAPDGGSAGAGTPGALDPHLWPSSAEVDAAGVLHLGGVGADRLVAEHGSPLYVLDEGDFRARARRFVQAFTDAFAAVGTEVDVYYAGKALLTVAVARWAHEEGLRIDTATGGELAVALRAGIPGPHIGLHGNNKSDDELTAALAAGVGRVVLDSADEVPRVAAAAAATGSRAPVMVRVTTGVHAGGHEYISTAHEDQKFGLSVAGGQAMEVLEAVAAHPDLDLVGIHSHIGSQILDPSGFEVAADKILRLRAELAGRTGDLVPEVDLGGGYGIAYLPGERPVDPAEIAGRVAEVVGRTCADLGTPLPRISIEPGRAVVGPAGVTLYTVGTVKQVRTGDAAVPERTYVSVDGGMSDNLRPALYGARYHAQVVSRRTGTEAVPARVVGKHCESGDVVVRDVQLPGEVRRGDVLAVPATGAYGRSMASNYNMVPRPPVVAVRAGTSRVLVRRETVEDLLGLDQG
ncbi:diaminopimelate decarboxylase [Cellulomonas bogoriensis]|uniref:Diaminopimelate decarboxylase n=1 Tax=Cellulomonas bogoriensis 69B4 = DSM 16987 TaxID=1386082 RepID=A0A0A0BQU8_9CELL|nr:diaminopimelate decarboxylase [Cellulomonas bogoriensis]KGM10341.1 diaminopimelate decarboxylase [Cellulomonas bogoriensis 69B4 = DSM 16987]